MQTIQKKSYFYCKTSLITLLAILSLQGCATRGYSVLASTGTIIGLEVSQNPATQMPQARLGYNRAELTYVPTNRNFKDDAGDTGGGARDTANVLMELRYGGTFDIGKSSAIYQRLAVGDDAVKQPGAVAMFLRNAEGGVDKNLEDLEKALINQIQEGSNQRKE
jgi:hypothetical protein